MKPDDIRARIETLKFALQTHGVDLAPYVSPGMKVQINAMTRDDIKVQIQKLQETLKDIA